MAEFALSSDPLERYAVLEQAYCDERWGVVIQDGQTLLTALNRDEPPGLEGLKERLQLLMAHAYLYGLGERDSAEDLYLLVLHSDADATLRQIAEEGLSHCDLPGLTPAIADEVEEAAVEPQAAPEAEASPSIEASRESPRESFWQESAAAGTGVPETPASSAMAPEAQDLRREGLKSPVDPDPNPAAARVEQSLAGPQDQGPLRWLTAEPPAAAAPTATPPVMPWLEEQPAAIRSPSPLAEPREPLPPWMAPSEPAFPAMPAVANEEVASQEVASDEAASMEAAVSAQLPEPGTEAADSVSPAAAAAPPSAEHQPAEAADPLSPSPQALAEPNAAPLAVATQRVVLEKVTIQPAQADAGSPPGGAAPAWGGVQEAAAGMVDGDPVDRRTSAPASEHLLIPEIVEEPDQIEVHQADPQRAEELELILQPELVEPAAIAPAGTEAAQASGLTDLDAPSQPDPQEEAEETEEETASSPGSARPTRRRGRARVPCPGPFADPPRPVAEEEAEMLMGLLKVEMG